MLTFRYYIRNLMEVSQFILVSSFFEIYLLNTTNLHRLFSFLVAIFMIFCFILLTGIIIYLIFTNYKLEKDTLNKLGEFFWDIQENKMSRFSVILLLFRRFVFVILLATLQAIPSRALIGMMIFIQLFYYLYIAFVRPYKEIMNNMIDILNETYFTLFLIAFILFNFESEWTSLRISIYMWILTSNSIIVFIIIFGKN